MAKVSKTIIAAYNKCAELAIKWENILDSFWHKDEKIPKSSLADDAIIQITDNLLGTTAQKALSENQGRVLKALIEAGLLNVAKTNAYNTFTQTQVIGLVNNNKVVISPDGTISVKEINFSPSSGNLEIGGIKVRDNKLLIGEAYNLGVEIFSKAGLSSEVKARFTESLIEFFENTVFSGSVQMPILKVNTASQLMGAVSSIFSEATLSSTQVGQTVQITKQEGAIAMSTTATMVAAFNRAQSYSDNVMGSLTGTISTASKLGGGNVEFITALQLFSNVQKTGAGIINYIRGLESISKIDNPDITVNLLQGLHPSLEFNEGTVGGAQVLLLDIDTNGGATVTGDLAYIQSGNDALPPVGGTAYFIKSLTELPSLFSGKITAPFFEGDGSLVTEVNAKLLNNISASNLSLGESYARIKQRYFLDNGYTVYATDAGFQYAKLLQANLLRDTINFILPQAIKDGFLGAEKGNDLTVVRTTTATYTDDNGVMQTALANEARIDYTNGSGVILVEPQRTNIFSYSEDFSNGYWQKIDSTISVNTAISPDGQLKADKFIPNNGGTGKYFSRTDVVDDGTYTLSFFAKSAEYTTFQTEMLGTIPFQDICIVTWDLANGAFTIIHGLDNATAKMIPYKNGWYRCILTYTKAGTATSLETKICLIPQAGNGVNGLYIWGTQLEVGSNATSYIPTVASSVTRNADVISLTGMTGTTTLTQTFEDGSTYEAISFTDYTMTQGRIKSVIVKPLIFD